jgi:hypothetical protein
LGSLLHFLQGFSQDFRPLVTFGEPGDVIEKGDYCIVFENFTASIGDLMFANGIYWPRVSGISKQTFATIKSTIDAVKFSNTIQVSPFV